MTKKVPLNDNFESECLMKNSIDSCVEFIEEGLTQGKVLVHCFAGISRSVTIAIAYLMKNVYLKDAIKKLHDGEKINVNELNLYKNALYEIQTKRSEKASPNLSFCFILYEYEKSLNNKFNEEKRKFEEKKQNQVQDQV